MGNKRMSWRVEGGGEWEERQVGGCTVTLRR